MWSQCDNCSPAQDGQWGRRPGKDLVLPIPHPEP